MMLWQKIIGIAALTLAVLAMWLFIGAVFGRFAPALRAAVRNGITAAADAIKNGGAWLFDRAEYCVRLVERLARTVGAKVVAADPVEPAPAAHAGSPVVEHNQAITVLVALGLLACIGTNAYLLYDIFPDLIELSPKQLKGGMTQFIAWLAPAMLLIGEVIGGIVVKYERRRKQAGVTEASTAIGWTLFTCCYVIELAAGVRRALSYLFVASPYTGEVVERVITQDSAVTAGALLALAAGIPWLIFLLSVYLEPALSASRIFGTIAREAWIVLRAFAMGLVGFVIGLAIISGGLLCGVGGIACSILDWIVRHVILALLVVLIVLSIEVPGIIWRHFRPGTGIGTAVFLFAVNSTGCSGRPVSMGNGGRSTEANARTFGLLSALELQPTPDLSTYEEVATIRLDEYFGKTHKVVRVVHAGIRICVADITGSIRPEFRRAIIEQCATFAAGAGPEIAGVVVPIIAAGYDSAIPMERIERMEIAQECAINPAIPSFLPRSTTYDRKIEELRRRYERALARCRAEVRGPYDAARSTRIASVARYVQRTITRFASNVPQRSDILGTLTRVEDVIANERSRSREMPVHLRIISDLEDDANGCEVRVQVTSGSFTVQCQESAVTNVRKLFRDPKITVEIHRVLQSPPGHPQTRAWVTEKRVHEARSAAWRAFWEHLAACTDCGPQHFTVRMFSPESRSVPDVVLENPGDRQHTEPSIVREPTPAPVMDASGPAGLPAPVVVQRCVDVAFLITNRLAVQQWQLANGQWLRYGRTLAACGPETKPWETVGLRRQAFVRQYVESFMNGDRLRKRSLFQARHPHLHTTIRTAWGMR